MNLFTRKRNKNDPTAVLLTMNKKQTRYEALVHIYSPDLYRYAYWICRDPDVAQDLMQETCLRAWKKLGSLLDDNLGAVDLWCSIINPTFRTSFRNKPSPFQE